MEIDTAACNCILSYDLFKEIVKKSADNPPILEAGSVIMKMADGTPSTAVKGSAKINIARADLPERSAIFKVIIVDGPHKLLGRPALKTLWNEQYTSFAESAKQSLAALCSNDCTACVSCIIPSSDNKCPATAVVAAEPLGRVATASEVEPSATNSLSTTIAADPVSRVATNSATKPTTTNSPITVLNQRPIPPPPTGVITQEIGEAYCRKIFYEVFPELFDIGIGEFKGVKANFDFCQDMKNI